MGSFIFSKAVKTALVSMVHRIYMFIIGARPLGKNSKIICVELQRYTGRAVKLVDGDEVGPDDQVMKLHFDHGWFKDKLRSGSLQNVSGQLEFLHDFKSDMQLLATQVKNGRYGRVKAVYGWTFLHKPATRLGFQVLELPNTLRIRLARWYIGVLVSTYHVQESRRRLAADKPIEINAVWLARAELLKLYDPTREPA